MPLVIILSIHWDYNQVNSLLRLSAKDYEHGGSNFMDFCTLYKPCKRKSCAWALRDLSWSPVCSTARFHPVFLSYLTGDKW